MTALGQSLALLLGQVTAEHVEQMNQVGSGRIVGGWEYVWTAYGIAWGGMALYALSLLLRLRRAGKGSTP